MDNQKLIEKYPWLQFKKSTFEYTWLDDLPIGWRIAFGNKMIRELDKILRKANYQNNYQITEIKEKYGQLCWYSNGVPSNIIKDYNKWYDKYINKSIKTCIECGKKGKIDYKNYWKIPLCKRCRKKVNNE